MHQKQPPAKIAVRIGALAAVGAPAGGLGCAAATAGDSAGAEVTRAISDAGMMRRRFMAFSWRLRRRVRQGARRSAARADCRSVRAGAQDDRSGNAPGLTIRPARPNRPAAGSDLMHYT